MTNSTTNRKCLFCEAPATSREHIIAEWLSKRMKATEIEFEPAIFSEDRGFKKHPKIKARQFRTKQVCKSCNNEWMSELEIWFEKKLGLLVESSWPRPVAEIIRSLRNESDSLIRWMI
jgi:Ni2+-binding GTPase involved in maturation of urease and hydrogenase